jgi:hypothetical protein
VRRPAPAERQFDGHQARVLRQANTAAPIETPDAIAAPPTNSRQSGIRAAPSCDGMTAIGTIVPLD